MSPRPIVFAVANSRKAGCGLDDPVLVQQRQSSRDLQNALDHEHHIRAASVIFVKTESDVVLQRPRQNAVAKFRDLLALLEDNRVLADEIDARDVAVEVDAHTRPVQPRGDLLDVSGFACAMIAGDHDAAVEGEAGEDGERRRAVEQILGIEIRDVFIRRGKRGNLHVRINAEGLAHRYGCIRDRKRGRCHRRQLHLSSNVAARPPAALKRTSGTFGSRAATGWASRVLVLDTLSARGPTTKSWAPAHRRSRSHGAKRTQNVISVDDFAQPVFVGAVAAVRVGMQSLDEFLVPSLDFSRPGVIFKTQGVKSLARDHAVPRRARLAGRAVHVERVAHAGARGARAVAHFPGWPMARDGVLLIAQDVLVAHAMEIVVSRVIFAHMIEAETFFSLFFVQLRIVPPDGARRQSGQVLGLIDLRPYTRFIVASMASSSHSCAPAFATSMAGLPEISASRRNP